MLESTIPKSIQEIIDEANFRPFTYKMMSRWLRLDPNTVLQRINRNPEYFVVEGDRPKVIKLNKDIEDIYFYRDKNTCQICQQKYDPSNLVIRFKDPYLKDEEDWENVITSCQNCKEINLIKKLSYKEKGESPGPGNYIWEYKEIWIREITKKLNPHMKLYFPDFKETEVKFETYCEFDELNGRGWFHISDENKNRCENLSDILNFFGKQGWEMIKMKDYSPTSEYEELQGYHGGYQCIFKRKKNLEEISND